MVQEGSVAKITGKEGERFSGVAAVFDSEEDMLAALVRERDSSREPARRRWSVVVSSGWCGVLWCCRTVRRSSRAW